VFNDLRSHPTAEAHPAGLASSRQAHRWGVARIVLLYAGFAVLWILLSDRMVKLLFSDPATMMTVSSLKGLAFILITSVLLYATLNRYVQGLLASEQKFSNIFHMSPDAIDLTHLDSGRLVELNRSYVNMFGYTRGELIGRSTLPDDLGIWVRAEDRAQHVAELRAHGIVVGREATLRRKDGSTFIAELCSSVLEIKGERYNLSLARDITAQKRAEEALRESNQRLELAIASASLGIWDRNLVDGTEIWSDRMYAINGIEPRAVPPLYEEWCRDILHPEDRAATEAAIQGALAGERSYDLDFRTINRDGTIRHIKSSGHVLRDAEGRPLRIIGINLDRTREVETEARQRRLQAELQHAEKLESIGSLAGGVAHDMNNVLAAIMGMSSAMRTTCADGDPQANALDTIIRACTRGRDVVKSLLYFARKDLEAAGPVNLNVIAQEMVHLLSYTTLSRVQIITDFQEPLGWIEGDSGALSHALINLCVNAVDAMPEGGSLQLSTRGDAQSVSISIKDSGMGMNPEVMRKAIEPFFTTKPIGKGTGLGLAMVYGTVKAHKGNMEIRSQPDQGTEVVLSFPPLAAPAPMLAGEAAPAAAQGAVRILLVDDDELIRRSIAPMLTALGHAVHTAESGQEALDRLQAGLQVDLVILDMNMPGLNGAQTLTRLLALRPDQIVLMATGYSDDAIAPLLEGRPNIHSLRKPFSLKEIQSKLGTMGLLDGTRMSDLSI
jgi:PAS domain S-box-containing protein